MIFNKGWIFTCIFFSIVVSAFGQKNEEFEKIEITENGHYLQYEKGTAFFWLGDTAWELLHRLRKEEIEEYLENRRQKGFNIIQTVILAESDGLKVPNAYGEVPFQQYDPEKPIEEYFQLVDWTVSKAREKNMFIGLLPTWGDKISKFWGKGPEVFTEQNAYSYGLFLGNRYKDDQNIIWIFGGDRPATNEDEDWRPIWRAMIKGLREGGGEGALITYHPWGESSSTDFWKDENLLDINMLQSGHAGQDYNVWDDITEDFNRIPPKPVLDGEPNYEDHPVDWNPDNGYFRDYDVRKQIYRSVFSGACGVTYGHHSIWQMSSDKYEKIAFAEISWGEALDRPGAFQAGYLKNLILSRPALTRVPDQTIILEGQGEDGEYITAFRDSNLSYAMIYLPVRKKIIVDISWMETDNIRGWWFNPVTGVGQSIGSFKKKPKLEFQPPAGGENKDWVLVIDDANKDWPAPGVLF